MNTKMIQNILLVYWKLHKFKELVLFLYLLLYPIPCNSIIRFPVIIRDGKITCICIMWQDIKYLSGKKIHRQYNYIKDQSSLLVNLLFLELTEKLDGWKEIVNFISFN